MKTTSNEKTTKTALLSTYENGKQYAYALRVHRIADEKGYALTADTERLAVAIFCKAETDSVTLKKQKRYEEYGTQVEALKTLAIALADGSKTAAAAQIEYDAYLAAGYTKTGDSSKPPMKYEDRAKDIIHWLARIKEEAPEVYANIMKEIGA